MTPPFTVYLDTSFFVKLCSAEKAQVDQTLNDLNTLQVRHVLSDIIILELLSSGDRTNKDATLVERVKKFEIAPYLTNSGLAWDILLLAGVERAAMADLLKSIDDLATEAKSSSIMARRKISDERETNLLNASRPLLRDLGFPDDMTGNLQQTMIAAKAMLENLGITNIDWPTNPTQENLLLVSEKIKESLGNSVLERLEKQDRLYDSVTATDDRPYQVAAKAASQKTRKKLANTYRDSEHMMRFVENINYIHVLQVDNAQEQMIRRNKPTHHLAELGLAEQCFSANTLSETVNALHNLKKRLFRTKNENHYL